MFMDMVKLAAQGPIMIVLLRPHVACISYRPY
jgi:hypothetical protein